MVGCILDLGCGDGKWPKRLPPPPAECLLIGVDVSHQACIRASQKDQCPRWTCVRAMGEQLPLRSKSVDAVVSTVAVPYMDIPAALSEMRRVLRPGGALDITLHPFSFFLQDLRCRPPLTLISFLYRLYVIANGLRFHFTGSTWAFPFTHRVESWQSKHGIRIALRRAGFTGIRCNRLPNKCFVVQAICSVPFTEMSPEKLPFLAAEPSATTGSLEPDLQPAEIEGKN